MLLYNLPFEGVKCEVLTPYEISKSSRPKQESEMQASLGSLKFPFVGKGCNKQ